MDGPGAGTAAGHWNGELQRFCILNAFVLQVMAGSVTWHSACPGSIQEAAWKK